MTDLVPAGEADKRTQRAIWRGMTTKSVRQLADETGLSMEATLRIRNELLDAVDALTIDQRRTKLLVDIQAISDRAREEFESTQDARSKAPLLATAVSAMKVVLNELRNLEKTGNREVEVLNAMRQREIVQVYEEGHMPFIEWLVDEKGLDREELEGKSQVWIMEAARKMDARHNG